LTKTQNGQQKESNAIDKIDR